MTGNQTTVKVNILDKEYLVACPEEARGELERAALHLDQKMREIRASGKVFGTERIAVMAALNITNDLLQTSSVSDSAEVVLRDMERKLDQVLGQ
jgi:cell division protein ZapA